MTKYHLNRKLKPSICNATKRACPLGVHIDASSMDRAKRQTAESREELLFQNALYPYLKSHILEATSPAEVEKPRKLLSKEQFYMLEDYSGMDFYDINAFLRDGKVNAKASLDRLKQKVELLDSVFQTVKPSIPYIAYRGEMVLLKSGETLEEAVTREFFPGSLITKASYVSTSVNPSIAAYFAQKTSHQKNMGRIVLEIKAKNGVSLKDASESSHEEEMLLPRNSSYKVIGVRPFAQYQKIDYDEESNHLHAHPEKNQIMTIILEEV